MVTKRKKYAREFKLEAVVLGGRWLVANGSELVAFS